MRRLRIVSDGILTRITDAETGEEIENVVALRIEQAAGEYARAWLEVAEIEMDMTADEQPTDEGQP